MVSQNKMDSQEHKRAIYTLQELGYLRDDKTHLMQTQLTKFYFDDGGGKRIYRESLTSIIEEKIKLLGITIAAIAGLITIYEAIAR